MLIKAGTLLIAALVALSGLATLTVDGGLALLGSQKTNAGSTLRSADCFPGNTAFLNPSANAADTGGDNNGFEWFPANAYANGGGYASNINGAADRHRYYNYNTSIKSSCAIKGIEVRLDWWLDSTSGTNSMSVELSWDGGASWTAAETDSQESRTEHTGLLGGSTDTWGRTWTVSELSNASFRVRLTSNSTSSLRDFYLDWVPVRVYYGPS
jgi:hypothetical protein